MTFKEYWDYKNKIIVGDKLTTYSRVVLKVNDTDIVNQILAMTDYAMSDIMNLDLRYDVDTTNDMMLSIWTKHIMRMLNIQALGEDINEKGLNYKEEGHNKSSFGYGGYDLQNQDGQFQANINTVNLSKTNYKDIIDIINKQQYNIYGPLKEDIIDQLLVIIY